MVVYNQQGDNGIYWSESVEMIWSQMSCSSAKEPWARELAPKLPHLGLADIFFLGAVANMENRPHGLMTWTAEMFGLSRVSLYALKKRVNERLGQTHLVKLAPPPPKKEKLSQYREVSRRKIDRFILKGTFPGNVSTRPMQELLQEAYGESRSVGYISQMRQEAGRRAGKLLATIRYESMGPVVAARDETFFDDYPVLIVIDPVSTAIVTAQVCPDRVSETWASVLLEATGQGLKLAGLVEDMAKMYPNSLKEADLDEVEVQKDIWHFLRDMKKVGQFLERQAYLAIEKVYQLEIELVKSWDDAKFEKEYLPAVSAESRRIDRYDFFTEWASHLADALVLVDPHSGDIRDFDINHWLLSECLTAFATIEHPAVKAFTKKLKKYQYQLLAFLGWTSAAVADFTDSLTPIIPDASAQQQFIRTVAKAWALKQAVINGHSHLQKSAQFSQSFLDGVTQTSSLLVEAASRLCHILDSACRTSSLMEMVNGLLKSFLGNRKSFADASHLQAYLNLFVLWHNSRIYDKRNKRGLSSPFQLAGIDLPSDWLTLLGLPPAQ